MTGLPWRPIITYGLTSTVVVLQYPQKLWGYESQFHGGQLKFSSGDTESFVIREDNRAIIGLRFHDCEYLEVRQWILDAMRGNTFFFQFDADDYDTVFECYLDMPTLKDDFKPTRMANWPDIWELNIVIRSVSGNPIFVSTAQTCAINATGGIFDS